MFPVAKLNLHRLNAVRLPKVKDMFQRVGRCEPVVQNYDGPLFPVRPNDKLNIIKAEAEKQKAEAEAKENE